MSLLEHSDEEHAKLLIAHIGLGGYAEGVLGACEVGV